MTPRRGRPRIHPPRESRRTAGHGVSIRSQGREMIIAARNFFEKENENIRQTNTPLIPFTQIQQRTAAALGVSKNTVWRVTMEKFNSPEESSKFSTPGKKRSRKSAVTDLDSFQEDAIRRHVYDYYIRREHPTVKKLLVSLRECDLFSGGYSSLYKVLHNLGFEYKRINGRKLQMERGDIVTLRCTFKKKHSSSKSTRSRVA
ncbi:hypothetical protein ANN_28370 [Periplaneta americana]|uniref:Winged helix-turn helix domain-containing protein n=1 Tax=Periplaneta americana TaxID=6978 RepID=A0ABQ8TPQ9_PERAM|nr:hypothetical protein ANN_28370 [Periplaneta americana]